MIPTNNELFTFQVMRRKPNSPYDDELAVAFEFKGRPASSLEKKNYRLMKGVEGNSYSISIFATNLPQEVQVGDAVKYLGKIWHVENTGYYFDNSLFVNASIMSDKYIMDRCPKGISIQ